MKKKGSYFTEEELLRLKEELSKPSFYEELHKRWEEADKEFDKMNEIPMHILKEPMTI